ncbi:glucokinase [Melghirimyces profundicolus]|uniref:Glucokinase n=1 Tax=Melghirimyces profundicolus TaxID=1242148 RepID=A0A2T6AV21_9BACL|nr:ROK family protein [Melghirimyces profundicolus]PTX47671.1 glucokinase [Melghirimyces profundicolus]
MNAQTAVRWYIGLDIGGTAIKAGLVSNHGHVALHRSKRNDVSKALSTVKCVIMDLLKDADTNRFPAVSGIGLASPGRVDSERGVVLEAINLKWRNVLLKQEVEHDFRLPTVLLNDSNAAALGELAHGSVMSDNFLCITLGTGIGAGIVLGGRMHEGARFKAGEIGHILYEPNGLKCVCGKAGCLETIASGSGIVRRYIQYSPDDETASCGKAVHEIELNDIVQLARQGSVASLRVLEEAAEALGSTVATIVQSLDLDTVVLSGGVAKMDWPFTERVEAAAHRYAPRSSQVVVRKSRLIDIAALLGVTALLESTHFVKS